VQRRVDRRFNRARYEAETAVATFAARRKDGADLNAVREDLAGVVRAALESATWEVDPCTGIEPGPTRSAAPMPRDSA